MLPEPPFDAQNHLLIDVSGRRNMR